MGSRGEWALKLKENKLWQKGPAWLFGQRVAYPISQIMETPAGTEKEKVVRTLAYANAKDEMSNVLNMCKFNIKITIIT